MNRWERLASMPPAEEAMLHFESADDPLDESIICEGCKEDWPCAFQRGMVATSNADWWAGRLRLALDALERTDGTEPDNSPLFWDGWHAAIAAVRVAIGEDGPGGLSTASRQRISQRSRSRLPLSELSRTPQTARSDGSVTREVLIGHVVVTDNPIYRPPSNETYCAVCNHGKSHHGHYDGKRGEWVDDGKCFVWTDAPRTASGRKRGPSGCRCKGWESVQ